MWPGRDDPRGLVNLQNRISPCAPFIPICPVCANRTLQSSLFYPLGLKALFFSFYMSLLLCYVLQSFTQFSCIENSSLIKLLISGGSQLHSPLCFKPQSVVLFTVCEFNTSNVVPTMKASSRINFDGYFLIVLKVRSSVSFEG